MWKSKKVPADLKSTVEAIYLSMEEPAKPAFTNVDLEELRSVIRLTVEFHSFLESTDLVSPNKSDVIYICESIFSGIESFVAMNNSYRILVGSASTTLKWEFTSLLSLREAFMLVYKEFLAEGTFEYRCRLLLDLYKMQVVFAGMQFD